MKYYTVHCMDCMCILGISKKKTWDKEIRCMGCGKIEINSHPTKQTVQTGSGDKLSGNLKRSGGSTKVKTDDLIMTGCPDEMEDVYDSKGEYGR